MLLCLSRKRQWSKWEWCAGFRCPLPTLPRPHAAHRNVTHLNRRVHQHSLLIRSCLSLRYGITAALSLSPLAQLFGVLPSSQTCPCRGNGTFSLCLVLDALLMRADLSFIVELNILRETIRLIKLLGPCRLPDSRTTYWLYYTYIFFLLFLNLTYFYSFLKRINCNCQVQKHGEP